MPASCAARATLTSGTAAPARMRVPSIAISLKPRPSRITTPGTPPSRTIRLEPSPMTVTAISAGRFDEEISEVGFVLRHEQQLRRPADAKPGQFGERLVGEQPAAQLRHLRRSDRRRCRESSCARLQPPVSSHAASTLCPASRIAGPSVRAWSRKLARIDAGLAEFDGVADQPGFEPCRLGLQMKLQARAATASRRTPAPGNARSRRACVQPTGNSQLSPCQCSTGVVPSGAKHRCLRLASVNVSGA